MNRWIVPPQVSPTANASSSEYPNVTTRGSVVAFEDRQGFADDGTFDASAADAARHLARLGDRHCGPGQSRAGSFDVDDTGDGDPLATAPPPVDVSEQFLHVVHAFHPLITR